MYEINVKSHPLAKESQKPLRAPIKALPGGARAQATLSSDFVAPGHVTDTSTIATTQ